jgi:hypothetical protein
MATGIGIDAVLTVAGIIIAIVIIQRRQAAQEDTGTPV